MNIFVDFQMPPDALDALEKGARPHRLLMPSRPAASVLSKAETDPLIQNAEVAMGQPVPAVVDRAQKLRWLHISTSSITRYDTPEFRAMAARRDLLVTNSAGVYNEACAAHALSFMLAQARKLPRSLGTRVPNGSPEWIELRSACGTLAGESLLIVGYGAIGRRLAELLAPFRMRISAYRRTASGDEHVPVVSADRLPAALASADHVMNILPDSPATRHFFGKEQFAQMKHSAVFYNIGRGTTVYQPALVEALRFGKLAAGWLDVTDPEPLPEDHPLRNEPRCHITPHVAGGHAGEARTLVNHFLANLQRFTRGEPLMDRVM